jgi:hypothetical protein
MNNFGDIEAGSVLRKNILLDKQSHEVTSTEELHDEVEAPVILERAFEVHNPRDVSSCKDVSLRPNMTLVL